MKNKKNILVGISLAVLSVVILWVLLSRGFISTDLSSDVHTESLLEPSTEAPIEAPDKTSAYRSDLESERSERQLEAQEVKGSDFYFDMASSDSEYEDRMAEKLASITSPESGSGSTGSTASQLRSYMEASARRTEAEYERQDESERQRQRVEERVNSDYEKKLRKQLGLDPSIDTPEDSELSEKLLAEEDSTPSEEESEESVGRFVIENGKRKRRTDNPISGRGKNLIAASIYGDQTIVSGGTVKLRLVEPLLIRGTEIPKHTIIYGVAQMTANRLKISVTDLRYGSYISPVSFTVYDVDALEGLNLPNNIKAESAKELGQGVSRVDLPISSLETAVVTDVISSTTQVARQLLGKQIATQKVHLKSNYRLYLKEETQEDVERRKKESKALNRAYEEYQSSKNKPKKKKSNTENPFEE
ncbi:MAG: conjugative transposon protein TraM [Bacteroides sp.]|nr:conjugative transposon protein TraM [Bacteroides sp.]